MGNGHVSSIYISIHFMQTALRFCQTVSHVMQLLSHFSSNSNSNSSRIEIKMKMKIVKNNNHHYFNCALMCTIVYDCPDFPFTFKHFHSMHALAIFTVLYYYYHNSEKAPQQCHIDLSFIHLNLTTWDGCLVDGWCLL